MVIHVISVNYNHYERFPTLRAMLTQYYNLVGWSEGLVAAGAQATVFQRYRRDLVLHRTGIPFHFIAQYGPRLRPWQIPWRIHRRIRQLCHRHARAGLPTVVHVNGIVFPVQTGALRLLLPRSVPIVVQHHGARPMRGWKRPIQKAGLRGVDGYLFTVAELAREWVDAGVIPAMNEVHEVMEGSSPFTYQDRSRARTITGMTGSPILFWAGNLDHNKDPLTVLEGFEQLLETRPAARLYMAFRRGGLLPEVERRVTTSPTLRPSVTLLGRLSRDTISRYFNSADLFVQGSAKEAAGLAVLDALACGVVPVVTDIPPFRRLTDDGRVGALWPVGDGRGFVAALNTVLARPLPPQSRAARDLFEERWSFAAVGREALSAYRSIWETRQKRIRHR